MVWYFQRFFLLLFVCLFVFYLFLVVVVVGGGGFVLFCLLFLFLCFCFGLFCFVFVCLFACSFFFFIIIIYLFKQFAFYMQTLSEACFFFNHSHLAKIKRIFIFTRQPFEQHTVEWLFTRQPIVRNDSLTLQEGGKSTEPDDVILHQRGCFGDKISTKIVFFYRSEQNFSLNKSS